MDQIVTTSKSVSTKTNTQNVSQKLSIELEPKAAKYLKNNPEAVLDNNNGRIEAVMDEDRIFIAECAYIFNIRSWRVKGNILEI